MARRAAKTDASQSEIVDALREAGISVFVTPIGNSFPDLVCAYRGYCALVECKTGTAKLTRGQEKFKREWQGTVIVVRTAEEAVREFFKAWSMDRLGRV